MISETYDDTGVSAPHVTIAPSILYFGTPVVLLSTENADGGILRIDTACHRDNRGAWRFFERLGFRALDEERLALLL